MIFKGYGQNAPDSRKPLDYISVKKFVNLSM